MYYQSKYAKYRIVKKPGYRKEVDGVVINIPDEVIKFNNFRYIPKNKEEEEFLDNLIKNGNHNFWKVTDEDIELAKKQAREMAELEEKYNKLREELKSKQINQNKNVVKGVKSTEDTLRK